LQFAAEAAAKFSADDWRELQATANLKSATWQERCAEAIGYIEDERSVPTLVVLLQSPSLVVASIAASELENLSAPLPIALESTLKKLLDTLRANRSPRSKDVERLIQLLK
jgi:HEAT repeat protein